MGYFCEGVRVQIINSKQLNEEQMEERLDEFLDPILSSRRTAASVAKKLAVCNYKQQEFVLHWVGVIAHTNAELAYQFANNVVQALNIMDDEAVEAWIIQAMDVYDKKGLHSAIGVLREPKKAQKTTGLLLEEIERILDTFIAGLSGRRLSLVNSEHIYTDTETLFLPALLNQFTNREENFLLYKAMAVHLWAQTRFGTWQKPFSLKKTIQDFSIPEKACQLFHTLERLRLDACMERELPGLHRHIHQMLNKLGETAIPYKWQSIAKQLAHPSATVQDSYDLLPKIYSTHSPHFLSYQGILMPDTVEEIMALRIAREKQEFRIAVIDLAKEIKPIVPENEDEKKKIETGFTIVKIPDESLPNGIKFELNLDGQAIKPPDNVKSLMDSIIQDIGMIPESYLIAAGDGGYKILDKKQDERDSENVWKGIYHEKGAFLYNEWDYERKHYRKNWCVLREMSVHPQYDDFVTKTLLRHKGLIKVRLVGK